MREEKRFGEAPRGSDSRTCSELSRGRERHTAGVHRTEPSIGTQQVCIGRSPEQAWISGAQGLPARKWAKGAD